MTPGKEFFYVVYAILCLCCLTNIAIGRRIRLHLKRHHPDIWRSFGFPEVSFFSMSRNEAQEDAASGALAAFLRSERRQALRDKTLERLLLTRRRLIWAGVPVFVATLVLMIIVRP